MTTKFNSELKAQANSTQQILTNPDVVLLMNMEGNYLVMPLDSRPSENYRSISIARAAADQLANETKGKVINKVTRVHII